jgi:hypothetical protein
MIIKKRGSIFVVLALFLLFFSIPGILTENGDEPLDPGQPQVLGGCYIYPEASEDLYCAGEIPSVDAQEDCQFYSDCNFAQHFVPGSDCSELDICQEIVCNVDCQLHTTGKCDYLGGEEVSDQKYPEWCNPGCCKIEGKEFCQFNLLKFECYDKAEKLGVFEQSLIFFSNPAGMNANTCNSLYCGVDLEPVELKVIVEDELGNALPGAKIVLAGTGSEETTDGSGSSTFSNLNSGSYSIEVTLKDYYPGFLVVSLNPGEIIEEVIVLEKSEGIYEVSGDIKSLDDQPLDKATVSWQGTISGSVTTNTAGEYQIPALPIGEYVISASKIGYDKEEEPLSVTSPGTKTLNFILKEAATTSISGKVYLDTDNNKVLDYSKDQTIYGAQIYLDGVFKGNSKFPDGSYTINFDLDTTVEEQEYELSAIYQNYKLDEKSFKISPNQVLENQDLLLTVYIGECTELGTEQEVKEFSGKPVLGKKQIKLEWAKPCPEVISYEIKRLLDGEEIEPLHASPSETSMIDIDVEWGNTYTYQIIAYYDQGRLAPKESEAAVEVSVSVGNELCENRYQAITSEWDTFCLIGNDEDRKKIWSCDNNNELEQKFNCQDQSGGTEKYYCAQKNFNEAVCKNAGGCGAIPQQADPFGLYYNRESCYGTSNPLESSPNYCYFDFTETVVDQCKDCSAQEMQNCFDYKSKDACEINNCLGTECSWVNGAEDSTLVDYTNINLPNNFVTPETGAGYCVEKDYDDDDKCGLCSPMVGIFKNNYCTAEVCSGLGECFSAYDLDICSSCGDSPSSTSNCYAYNTELECNGGNEGGEDFSTDIYDEITLSKDRCGWGRCLWTGPSNGFSKNGCVKDGNGDKVSDCEIFLASGEADSCKLDHSAPRTKILPAGVNIISYATPEITFYGDDGYHDYGNQRNFMGTVSYCLTDIAQDKCFNDGGESPFIELDYSGNDVINTLSVDLTNSTFLLGNQIQGETYKLKYYSTDKFFNQENVQETFVFIDNVVPEFTIKEEIETIDDITNLAVYLEDTNEIMGCTFTLQQILPIGETIKQTVLREEELKEVEFGSLNGIKFGLNVTCVDDQGNENTKNKNYTFDLEERIDIIYPEPYGAVAETKIAFKAETVAGTSCELYLTATNEKVADFVSDSEGKVHQTEKVSGFIEGTYSGDYKIVCQELFNETEDYEDYYHFVVDFTPPSVQISLTEGSRPEVEPTVFNWEEYFIEFVNVDFSCVAEGFDCADILYCLGDDCDFISNAEYSAYSSTLELTESTRICYYAVDEAENPVYQPMCGDVLVEGYGITLEIPELHYYLEEQWGISNKPIFDWQFFTRAPTVECRFDFTADFDYNEVASHKIRELDGNGKYLFESFPESVFTSYPDTCFGDNCIKAVYVKCKDYDQIVGPEQIIYLEYDPTAPGVIDAYANPDEVFEGITTELIVETDDKTLCKYSDNSANDGINQFSDMEYSFPGTEEKELDILHSSIFNINFAGPTKEYNLLTQCKNGAGDLSEVEEIDFIVDYSKLGFIIEGSLLPNGYVQGSNLTLSVQTSKDAFCEYDLLGAGYVPFTEGANTQIHSSSITISEEKDYLIPVKCVMGDHTAYGEIKFTFDVTAPQVTSVEDGNLTCGSDHVNVMVYTTESNITSYYYEVYDLGQDFETKQKVEEEEQSGYDGVTSWSDYYQQQQNTNNVSTEENTTEETLSVPKNLLLSGELGPDLPLKIPTKDLIKSNNYKIKVRAVDAAGNEGDFAESDGVLIVNSNYSVCQQDKDAPIIKFKINDSSCSKVEVEMVCEDSIGCQEFLYGKHASSNFCEKNKTYAGQKISLLKTSWICYYVEDNMGNNHTDEKKIVFSDSDGDGISDSCDECKSTEPGATVNELGCSDGEVPESQKKVDTDGDGLPDYWEKNYDAADCSLSFDNEDSDDNGVADNFEDYDGDTYSNYEEYISGYNPCLADTLPEEEDQKVDTELPSYSAPADDGDFLGLLAIIFLIFGLLMIIGGSGYLVYYYLYSPAAQRGVVARTGVKRSTYGKPATVAGTGPGVTTRKPLFADWKDKLLQLKKSRGEKLDQRKREEVFGKFGKTSKKIPHVDKFLSKKAPHLNKLQDLATTYTKHKETIKPGLRKEEKGIFNKLESIAKKTKNKDIKKVVKKDEAKDIFSQLKNISKKRKK